MLGGIAPERKDPSMKNITKTIMYLQNRRVLKEARALFWPWCAITFAGLLPLLPLPSGIGDVSLLIATAGFWIGIPLMATLSLGNEFQHRTLSLMLSQPVDRGRIWGEKSTVTICAVLSTLLVYAPVFHGALQQEFEFWLIPASWIVITVCSAMFWTLVARSTI